MQLVASLAIEWRGPTLKKSVQKAISARIKKAGIMLQRGVIQTVSTPLDPNGLGTRAKAGQPPRAELGNLKRSIQTTMIDDMTSAVFVDGPAQKRAVILEFGGTIRPKSKRALAVPLSPNARRHRGPTREFRPNGQDLVPIKRPGKPTLLIEKHGRKGGELRKKWTIHYMLVDSVRIPAHPFLRPTLTRMAGTLAKLIGEPLGPEHGFDGKANFKIGSPSNSQTVSFKVVP